MLKQLMVLLLGVWLSGCADSPTVEFYVLEQLSKPALPNRGNIINQQTIGIGPVTVPALLERKQIITRTSDNTVKIAESQQWASPLQDSLLQTLSRNLSGLQAQHIIRAYPWAAHGAVDLQVIVDFIRFDTTPGKSANLEANWTIKNETSREIVKTGHSIINRPMTDSTYPGTVRILSIVLGDFSRELAGALTSAQLRN